LIAALEFKIEGVAHVRESGLELGLELCEHGLAFVEDLREWGEGFEGGGKYGFEMGLRGGDGIFR
jgi:hypothetical protein